MKIAIIGFGSVGKGLAGIISRKNLGITITAVADSKSGIIDNQGLNIPQILENKRKTGLCGDKNITAEDIIKSADYDVLVEVTPTNAISGQPALNYIKCALSRGKSVVTSNKGPVALEFKNLMEIAESKNCYFKYEATVCGAIPLIHALQHGLAGNKIKRIYGIFNGTCNYILTRMSNEKLTYKQALSEARELGYAEADPTYDIKGIDTAIKLVILANTIFGFDKTLDDVEITGIDNVPSEALQLAHEEEKTIRLIGEINAEDKVLRVSPRVLPKNHTLVVSGTLNAVTAETDLAGDVTFIGKGAGSVETASAIISDLLFISGCNGRRN
ncbi:homoserine dehydrogenase [Methanomicrobium sp. W14]|jgi:homoserine dehydrogenase|uniref:homoserine dehydrogenase n=1 Tax=Methanomicrobium sp. W14 TaxID=2817839 RepID=UPI001AE8BDE8|nr:homoserine dehydrogenase [Methanomicrobium sp. W14]MBP2132641.1 homoserine dehydrogenase [Methanomicrobium sp. W14]